VFRERRRGEGEEKFSSNLPFCRVWTYFACTQLLSLGETERKSTRSLLSCWFSRWWCSGQFFVFFSLSLSLHNGEKEKDRHCFEGRQDVLVGSTVRIEQRNGYVSFFFSVLQEKTSSNFFASFPFCFSYSSHHVHNGVYNASMCIFPRFPSAILFGKKKWEGKNAEELYNTQTWIDFFHRLCGCVCSTVSLLCTLCLRHSFFVGNKNVWHKHEQNDDKKQDAWAKKKRI